jgi:2-dehydro-3-deoxygalactonokinase
MGVASFVAGDWGTSHLLLFLCDENGAALDSARGPGIGQVSGPCATAFDSLLERWETQVGTLPAVLCGMVGSSIGWMQTPYISCPAIPDKVFGGCVSLRGGRLHIVPGLRCRNRLQAPDFMRGEETQILGAARLDASLGHGRRLLCLPGTHTKWVVLEEGIIKEFLTAPTGELFAAVRNHSVLVRDDCDTEAVLAGAAFEQGLQRFGDSSQAHLLHRLFECRGRQLDGELSAHGAAAFLSGLLIASDVNGALTLFAQSASEPTVHLIGAPRLTQLYARALSCQSFGATELDGAAASLAGLTRVHQHLSPRLATSAV